MKRAMAVVVAMLALGVGAASAGAHENTGIPNLPGITGPVAPVLGTVVSTDPANGTFVANAYVLTPPAGGLTGGNGGNGGSGGLLGNLPPALTNLLGGILGHLGAGNLLPLQLSHGMNLPQPTTTQVTISTDSNTRLLIDGHQGTVADLAAGDRFAALFNGSLTDSVQTLTSSPAVAILAHAERQTHQVYAFVGTVKSVDTGGGTVTVDVSRSIPSGLAPAGSGPATFTVSPDTLVLGPAKGGSGGSLSGVSTGDVVAGGLVGPVGETLAQVESQPLKVLFDFPAMLTNANGHAKRKALKRVLAALSGHKTGHSRHKHNSHHHK